MIDLLKDPDNSLQDQLFEEYLVKTSRWLLRGGDSESLLAKAGNSNWECAMSMNYLLFIHEEISAERENYEGLKHNIRQSLPRTVDWMIKQVKEPKENIENTKYDSNEMVHWDGVTWDTAVCIRGSLQTLDRFSDEFSSKRRKDIQTTAKKVKTTAKKALKWLVFKFNSWEDSVMYSYGPADVAQILITACVVHERYPDLINSAIDDFYDCPDEFIQEIIEYLTTISKEYDIDDQNKNVPYWGDPFQSAEVIDSLTKYISKVEEGKYNKNEMYRDCQKKVNGCMMYIEDIQEDGKWGTHSDTCRTLYAYLRATNRVEDVESEPHIIFKSVRWICDEKQTFDDGSYLHTMYLTVFYALALEQTYKFWPLAREPVIKVLDKALWSAPVRSSQERGQRLQLEIEYDNLESRQVRTQNRMALSVGFLSFSAILLFSVIVSLWLNWIQIGDVKTTNLLTYYSAFVLVIGITTTSVIYKYLSNPNNKFVL